MERDGCACMSISFCFVWKDLAFAFPDVSGKNDKVSILVFFLSFYRKKVEKSNRMFENVLIFASFKSKVKYL